MYYLVVNMSHPFILHIETSTEVCSVALSQDNRCIAVRENSDGRNHATMLTLFVEELLKEQKISVNQLNAIAVSSGPGSYTGLRIGLSTAKGMCYGAGIPLIAVSTLHAMCYGLLEQHPVVDGDILLCPMIDARRMEVYTALYDKQGNVKKDVSAEIITEDSFRQWLDKYTIYFFGNGAAKCSGAITHPNAIFVNDYLHSARYMIPDAIKAFNEKHFEDVAYFEPFYLKDFIAGKPKQILSTLK